MVREAEKHADADRQRKVSGVKVYVNIQYICTSYGENIWSLFFLGRGSGGNLDFGLWLCHKGILTDLSIRLSSILMT